MSSPQAEPNLTVESITESDLPSNVPDEKATLEQKDLELAKQQATLDSYRQDTEERKTYANRCFRIVAGWLVAIWLVVFLQGWKIWSFDLPPSVMIALISTTTGSVVGIFLIVARYLFPKRG